MPRPPTAQSAAAGRSHRSGQDLPGERSRPTGLLPPRRCGLAVSRLTVVRWRAGRVRTWRTARVRVRPPGRKRIRSPGWVRGGGAAARRRRSAGVGHGRAEGGDVSRAAGCLLQVADAAVSSVIIEQTWCRIQTHGLGAVSAPCRSHIRNMRPQQDSNLRTRLRRPLLYPLSYGGWRNTHAHQPGRHAATRRLPDRS